MIVLEVTESPENFVLAAPCPLVKADAVPRVGSLDEVLEGSTLWITSGRKHHGCDFSVFPCPDLIVKPDKVIMKNETTTKVGEFERGQEEVVLSLLGDVMGLVIMNTELTKKMGEFKKGPYNLCSVYP